MVNLYITYYRHSIMVTVTISCSNVSYVVLI